MELTLDQQKGLEILNLMASTHNSTFTQPDDMKGVVVYSHKLALKIPTPAQAQNAMETAYNYLDAYMDVAALNDGLGEVVFEVMVVDESVDSTVNAFDGYCHISLQRYLR